MLCSTTRLRSADLIMQFESVAVMIKITKKNQAKRNVIYYTQFLVFALPHDTVQTSCYDTLNKIATH